MLVPGAGAVELAPMRSVIALLPVLVGTVLLLGPSPDCRGENWPGFRGPTGLGYTSEANLPTSWGGPERKNVRWASPLHGQGHASPVVWDDRVFVCTAAWPAGTRDAEREKVMPEHHVACYDAKDGALRWDATVPP